MSYFENDKALLFFQFEHIERDIKIIFNQILGVELDEVMHVNSGDGKNKKNKRVVIITGGNTGLGCISAKEIARLSMNADDENGGKEKEFSYSVVIACRSIERGQKAMRDVGLFLDDEERKEGETNPSVDVMECDLSSFKSTRAFAEKFKSKYDRLDVIKTNAGVMALPEKTRTEKANEEKHKT